MQEGCEFTSLQLMCVVWREQLAVSVAAGAAAVAPLPGAHRHRCLTAIWCLWRPLRTVQELQRILADKELKDALLSGIEAFNDSAVKGGAGARRARAWLSWGAGLRG